MCREIQNIYSCNCIIHTTEPCAFATAASKEPVGVYKGVKAWHPDSEGNHDPVDSAARAKAFADIGFNEAQHCLDQIRIPEVKMIEGACEKHRVPAGVERGVIVRRPEAGKTAENGKPASKVETESAEAGLFGNIFGGWNGGQESPKKKE